VKNTARNKLTLSQRKPSSW